MDKTRIVSLRIPDELHAKVKATATREGRSLNSQILKVLADSEGHTLTATPEPQK